MRADDPRHGRTDSGAVTLQHVADRFPPGVTVKAYDRAGARPGARPAGSVLASAIAADDGSLRFDGLPGDRRLTAHAFVAGESVRVDFSTYDRHPARSGI
jgi:hypothetical protein